MSKQVFITGIGTDVGKSIVSAIICEKTGADYWKPIQSGIHPSTDTEVIKRLISNKETIFHKESYLLKAALSPHLSAKKENIEIDINKIVIPPTSNNIVIEGAGGIMVPISSDKYIIDIIKQLDVPVVIVSKNYLGSINHTLMTIEILKANNIDIKGIVFNGDNFGDNLEFILNSTNVAMIGHIKQEEAITKQVIQKYSRAFNFSF